MLVTVHKAKTRKKPIALFLWVFFFNKTPQSLPQHFLDRGWGQSLSIMETRSGKGGLRNRWGLVIIFIIINFHLKVVASPQPSITTVTIHILYRLHAKPGRTQTDTQKGKKLKGIRSMRVMGGGGVVREGGRKGEGGVVVDASSFTGV